MFVCVSQKMSADVHLHGIELEVRKKRHSDSVNYVQYIFIIIQMNHVFTVKNLTDRFLYR